MCSSDLRLPGYRVRPLLCDRNSGQNGQKYAGHDQKHGIFLTHGYGSLTGAGAELLPDCRASETFAGRFAAAAAIPAALF